MRVIRVSSRQGHAGTVPMALRADPLAGAAEAVAAIERRCGGGRYPDPLQDAGESWLTSRCVWVRGCHKVEPGALRRRRLPERPLTKAASTIRVFAVHLPAHTSA